MLNQKINFTFAICTLGCRVNQYESDCIISEFIKLGFELKDFSEICDVYVINTCTVTANSDKKSKQMIRRAKKLNPNAIIAVCGCFSQKNPDFNKDLSLKADIVLGTTEKTKIPNIALEILENEKNKSKNINININRVKNISEYKTYEKYKRISVRKYAGLYKNLRWL